jgi:hypothetical protein
MTIGQNKTLSKGHGQTGISSPQSPPSLAQNVLVRNINAEFF